MMSRCAPREIAGRSGPAHRARSSPASTPATGRRGRRAPFSGRPMAARAGDSCRCRIGRTRRSGRLRPTPPIPGWFSHAAITASSTPVTMPATVGASCRVSLPRSAASSGRRTERAPHAGVRAVGQAVAALVICLTGVAMTPLPPVTPAAVWRPAAGFMERFHRRCDGRQGAAFDACFAAEMAAAGASPAALDFTRRLDNEGFLAALDPTGGRVSVAHVVYPFRANQNEAWLLVNGSPPLIDVDDFDRLDLTQLDASPVYRTIRRRYPNAMLWPGQRGPAGPEVGDGGREIVVGYLLRDLCHACAIVGRVRFAFEFGNDGRFLGAKLRAVTPAAK